MRLLLKICRWVRNNKLILFLAIVTFVVLGYPLFISGIEKSFYMSTDPDIVYVTNALLYTKSAVITYTDHPGTPTIMLLYYLFVPFRLIAKYILHQGFIQWSFDNYAFLTYCVRLFQLALYSLSVLLFLKLIQKISKSVYLNIFAWMAVLSFAGSNYALFIAPENFSFFLTAIWLTLFLKFVKKPSYFLSILLAIISGFALANKFTCLFLLIPSLAMVFYIRDMKTIKKFAGFSFNFLISGLLFYVGILPAIIRFDYIAQWVRSLFYHAGRYGTGKFAIFDWTAYFVSVSSLIRGNWVLTLFVCITVVLAIYLLIKKKLKITNPVIFLFITTVVGIAAFAKYPIIHYNYVNIILLVFCVIFFLSKVKLSLVKILLPFMIIVFILNMRGYEKGIPKGLEERNPQSINSILNIWTTSYWSGNLFREELDTLGFTKP